MRLLMWFSLLSCLPLVAADVSGTWEGSLRMVQSNGEVAEQSISLILQQSGDKITGSAGSGERRSPIANGEIDANEIVRCQAGNRFLTLKVSINTMHGEVRHAEEPPGTGAQLVVKRKPEARSFPLNP